MHCGGMACWCSTLIRPFPLPQCVHNGNIFGKSITYWICTAPSWLNAEESPLITQFESMHCIFRRHIPSYFSYINEQYVHELRKNANNVNLQVYRYCKKLIFNIIQFKVNFVYATYNYLAYIILEKFYKRTKKT